MKARTNSECHCLDIDTFDRKLRSQLKRIDSGFVCACLELYAVGLRMWGNNGQNLSASENSWWGKRVHFPRQKLSV